MSEHGSTTYIHLLHGHAIEQVPEQLVGVHLVPLVPVLALSVEGLHERLGADCALLAGPELYEGVCEGGGAAGVCARRSKVKRKQHPSVSMCASGGSLLIFGEMSLAALARPLTEASSLGMDSR